MTNYSKELASRYTPTSETPITDFDWTDGHDNETEEPVSIMLCKASEGVEVAHSLAGCFGVPFIHYRSPNAIVVDHVCYSLETLLKVCCRKFSESSTAAIALQLFASLMAGVLPPRLSVRAEHRASCCLISGRNATNWAT